MRLIDADKLFEVIYRNDLEFKKQTDLMMCIKDIIDRQPTVSESNELKAKQDFESLKSNDKLIVEYSNGRMYLLNIVRIENGHIVGRIDFNSIQETFINIESLINEYIGNHIKSVMKMIKS